MSLSEFRIETEDGLRLHCQEWAADESPKAVVSLVHGHREHTGRYGHLARFLNGVACTVLGIDLRGHGRSDGKRGHFPGYRFLMSDVSRLLSEARTRHPDRPLFLYGHSMGANLIINHALRCDSHASGLIASSPLLGTAVPSPRWKTVLGKVMLHLRTSLSLSSGLRKWDLSRDADVVRAYDEDPLIHDRLTPRFLEILQAGEWALEHASSLSLPLLLMHGMRDRITSVEASREFAASAGPECTLRLMDDLYHEIHNEGEQEQVFRSVGEWLARRW